MIDCDLYEGYLESAEADLIYNNNQYKWKILPLLSASSLLVSVDNQDSSRHKTLVSPDLAEGA